MLPAAPPKEKNNASREQLPSRAAAKVGTLLIRKFSIPSGGGSNPLLNTEGISFFVLQTG